MLASIGLTEKSRIHTLINPLLPLFSLVHVDKWTKRADSVHVGP